MWEVVHYKEVYFSFILHLAEENYGADNDTANGAFIAHEYFENPSGNALIDVALDTEKNRLGGLYAVVPTVLSINGVSTKCVLSLNTLTHEDYRGQGVFTTLAEHVYQRAFDEAGCQLCYGMPNQNSYPGFMKRLHFSSPGSIPLYVRPLVPSSMVGEYTGKKALRTMARPMDPFFRLREARMPPDVRIKQVTHENVAALDTLWETLKTKYPVLGVRNAAFVQYRYLDMPCRSYGVYLAFRGDTPVAFSAGRVTAVSGLRCGMLADFIYAPGEQAAAAALLHCMTHWFYKAGASMAGSLMLQHTQEARLLKRAGFFRCPAFLEPQPFPLIVRDFSPDGRYAVLQTMTNWFFTMGDYDAI